MAPRITVAGSRRLALIRIGALALITTLGVAPGCEEAPREGRERVIIGGQTFWLEPALDEPTRFRGLGGRSNIEPDGGMLFAFTNPLLLSFVMRDCLTDIDIAYLDGAGRVVATHEMKMEPPREAGEDDSAYETRLKKYPSRYASQIVIEVAPGTLRKLGVKPGDLVTLDAEGLKRRAK